MKHFTFIVVVLCGMSLYARAEERSETYSVVGIADDDALSVRSRPSQSSSIVARLRNGATGIQVVGQTVMNGNDDWVPIIVAGIKGWVRPKYLSRSTTAIATGESETTELHAQRPFSTTDPPTAAPLSQESGAADVQARNADAVRRRQFVEIIRNVGVLDVIDNPLFEFAQRKTVENALRDYIRYLPVEVRRPLFEALYTALKDEKARAGLILLIKLNGLEPFAIKLGATPEQARQYRWLVEDLFEVK